MIATTANRHDSDTDGTSEVHGKPKENSRPKRPEKNGGSKIDTKRHDSDSDQSPIRQIIDSPKRTRDSRDLLPPRNHSNRHDSGSDNSTPRNHSNRHDSSSDNSPPRNRTNSHKSSPVRKMLSSSTAHVEYDDSSCPKARPKLSTKKRSDGSHKPQYDSLSDSSPSRRDQKNIPRRSGTNGHISNPHTPHHSSQNKSNSSQSDLSPTRLGQRSSLPNKRRASSGSDQSPPRYFMSGGIISVTLRSLVSLLGH